MKDFTVENAFFHAQRIFATRYKGAEFCVASGSIIRGDGTYYSDLDLVVVYPKIETAYRESYFFEEMPVEAFVHDYETMQFFMDSDYDEGSAAMQHMVATGLLFPQDVANAIKLQGYAKNIICAGLEKPTLQKIDMLRYAASDLIDDLKGQRTLDEQHAILYTFYQTVGELRLRLAGQFLSSGKHLAKKLKACDPVFFERLNALMAEAHRDGVRPHDIEKLILLLEPLGGYLFDGYKMLAPIEKRKSATWLSDTKLR